MSITEISKLDVEQFIKFVRSNPIIEDSELKSYIIKRVALIQGENYLKTGNPQEFFYI